MFARLKEIIITGNLMEAEFWTVRALVLIPWLKPRISFETTQSGSQSPLFTVEKIKWRVSIPSKCPSEEILRLNCKMELSL